MKISPAKQSLALSKWLHGSGRGELVTKSTEVPDADFQKFLEQSKVSHPHYTPDEHWAWAAYTCLTINRRSPELQRALRRARFWTLAWQILVLLFLLFIALRVARSESFRSGAHPDSQVLDYEKEARR